MALFCVCHALLRESFLIFRGITATIKLSNTHLAITMIIKNAETMASLHPQTFAIPNKSERTSCKVGDNVKLVIEFEEGTERLWIEITEVAQDHYDGKVNNEPALTKEVKLHDPIRFSAKHIINIY